MHKKPKILVVGSFVMDLTVTTERFPDSGETVLGRSFKTAPGGKGANQAVQAARLGADVTMVGKVGNDDFGKRLINSCREAGIHTEHILVGENSCSAVGNVILEVGAHKTTANRIIVIPGANMEITPDEIGFLKDSIGRYDLVILQLEIPMEINELVAEYAYNSHVPVMLNPAPSAKLSPALLSRLTYLSPNEHEAADLTGIPIRREGKTANPDDVGATLNALLAAGVRNAVITLGNAGVAAADGKDICRLPCVDVVEVKDPTAAGDSFVGAFSAGVCMGMKMEQALTFANFAATLTVSRAGAQPSLPSLEEVVGLLKSQHNSLADFFEADGTEVSL